MAWRASLTARFGIGSRALSNQGCRRIGAIGARVCYRPRSFSARRPVPVAPGSLAMKACPTRLRSLLVLVALGSAASPLSAAEDPVRMTGPPPSAESPPPAEFMANMHPVPALKGPAAVEIGQLATYDATLT